MTILGMFHFTPEALYVCIFAIVLGLLGFASLWIATALALVAWLAAELLLASLRPSRYRLRCGGLQLAFGFAGERQ